LEQRFVVLLGRLERIGAYDRLARIVSIAVAPRRGARRVAAHEVSVHTGPETFDRERTVAAEVARIAPQVPIRVEILRREEIHRKRLDARRCFAALRQADEPVPRHRGADRLELIDVMLERRRATDADETDLRGLLRVRSSAGDRKQSYRDPQALLHGSPSPRVSRSMTRTAAEPTGVPF